MAAKLDDVIVERAFDLARECAQEAGKLFCEGFYGRKSVQSKSSSIDLVTEYDKACEDLILDRIKAVFPESVLVAEESDSGTGEYPDFSSGMVWFIDPIDGTNNFVHGIPWTCISIGCSINGIPAVGVVYNPIMNEEFTARVGKGAFLNGNRISVSKTENLEKALLITEMGYSRDSEGVDRLVNNLRQLLLHNVQSVRLFGSCALNMCSIACGRGDVYYEGLSPKQGPKPWDFGAARLIVTEAGGLVLDHDGSQHKMASGRVLCAATKSLAGNVASILTSGLSRL